MERPNGHKPEPAEDGPQTIFEAYVSYLDDGGKVRWKPSDIDHGEAATIFEGPVQYTEASGRAWVDPSAGLGNNLTVICDPPPVELRP